jgi:hypothetical protein
MSARPRVRSERVSRPLAALLMFATVLMLAGCATMLPIECSGAFAPRVQDTLFFGGETPDGAVDAAQWEAFVREEVTPRFPDGLTTWAAKGQWRDARGRLVREDTQVLALVHAGDARSLASVDAVARAYAQRFRQESVMRVRGRVCVAF